MPRKKKLKFEDCIEKIDLEINKRRSRWNLTALSWMDFDDVSQIIRIHIFKKWHLYDQSKSLAPWINTLISNQIKNLIRNNYGNYCRPCLKCAAAESDSLCYIYGTQCSSCPLFAQWEKTKKAAYLTKLPTPLESVQQETEKLELQEFDFNTVLKRLNLKLRKVLKSNEWTVYENLYLKNKTEQEVAKILGYKTSEKNRSPGYKQIKNIKKSIIEKAKEIIFEDVNI
jgi:RNA polymerase sigma factor (sigma-70 family)|tara:strand:+ start:630 stop:1310 length:681 start_codon:yes stop_codon:yes gene_type:complete